jgi:hypothetical protein
MLSSFRRTLIIVDEKPQMQDAPDAASFEFKGGPHPV